METDKKHPKLSNYRAPLPSELQSLKTARTRTTFSRQGEKPSATLKGETAVSRRGPPPNTLLRSQHVSSRSGPVLPDNKRSEAAASQRRNPARCPTEAQRRCSFLHLRVCQDRLQRGRRGSLMDPGAGLTPCWGVYTDRGRLKVLEPDAAALKTKQPN